MVGTVYGGEGGLTYPIGALKLAKTPQNEAKIMTITGNIPFLYDINRT